MNDEPQEPIQERIIIDENQMQRIGDYFIRGTIATRHPSMTGVQHRSIETTIVFKESSFRWKSKHGGPKSWVIPEHVCRCLMKEIMDLTKEGYNVTIISEPEEEN